MAYLGQMFDHTLDILKGKSPNQLDIVGSIDAAVNIGSVGTPPPAGSCMHISSVTAVTNSPSTPVFAMGANLNMMPLFLLQNADDFDVSNPGVVAGVALGGDSTHKPAWVPIMPTGNVNCLVAKGAIEISVTEFDTAQTYAANDFLRAVTSNTDANAGKLTNQDASGGQPFANASKAVWGLPASAHWESVVGRVSRGVYTNYNGKSVLAFWPESLPGSR